MTQKQARPCPICEADSDVIETRKPYLILKCPHCGLRFSDPMRDPGADYYKKSLIYSGRSAKALSVTDDWRHLTGLKKLGKGKGRHLLDIGCGDGAFLWLAHKQGFEVYGVDLDVRAVELAKIGRGLKHVYVGAWYDADKIHGAGQFDVVTLFDVLEHVSDPKGLVQAMFNSVKAAGMVCVSVPRFDRVPYLLDEVADYPPHHFTLWTRRSLTILLESVGFVDVEVTAKPLMATDLGGQLRWRFTRRQSRGRMADVNMDGRRDNKIERKWQLLRAGLKSANWLLETFKVGRGYTLLAMATKPKNDVLKILNTHS